VVFLIIFVGALGPVNRDEECAEREGRIQGLWEASGCAGGSIGHFIERTRFLEFIC
jgi:hypothetical protein